MNTLPDHPLFYDADCQAAQQGYVLSDTEAHHALHVLRLQIGAQMLVSNGLGTIWTAEVTEVSRNTLHYQCLESLMHLETTPFNTSVACGILGAVHRMETMVEKLVEIGVKDIYFYSSARTGKHKGSIKRLEKVAIAALKQSRKAFLPTIHLTTVEGLLQVKSPQKLLASCVEPSPPHLQNIQSRNENLVVIGPEGDFTTQELDDFEHNGFTLCSLGSERLRSETASVYALICQQLKHTH